jgi:hypothetical protein
MNSNKSSNETALQQHQPFGSIPFDQIPPPSCGSKSYLYVIGQENAYVFYDSVNPASLGARELFGDCGFLFGRQHSASIVAGSHLECWVVDHNTSLKDVLPSKNL